jgi:hypothetical protein
MESHFGEIPVIPLGEKKDSVNLIVDDIHHQYTLTFDLNMLGNIHKDAVIKEIEKLAEIARQEAANAQKD